MFKRDGRNRAYLVAGAFEQISGYTFDEFIHAAAGFLLSSDDLEQDAQDMEKLRNNHGHI